ncbi:MAG: RagB/SusD family nutrient uptake outer membrane protein [Bacteroidota bacterium]
MKNLKYLSLVFAGIFVFTSCTKDLDLEPEFGINSASVYNDPSNYINVLAKIYAGLTLSGQEGPAGQPDIADIDEGFSSYIRVYWNLQQLPTDESICGWNDTGIPELNTMTWGSSNSFTKAMYSRLYFQIAVCNEFIRECSDENMDRRGFSQADKDQITAFRSEARFLRALSWYHAIDLFGSVPFTTEADGIGSFLPEQISRTDLFDYVETELLELEDLLAAPGTNEYARADRAAAWFLLAKLYLNAEVYTGNARYANCATYCNKILGAGYSLHDNYPGLFLADNHLSPEIIFPIACDGLRTQAWGGMTFMVHAFMVGANMTGAEFGVNGGWNGYRSTKAFSDKFLADSLDSDRFQFYIEGQTQEINNIGTASEGWPMGKYKNVDSNGNPGSDVSGNHVDTDFPLMRLAEVYLMYAECAVRGAGDIGTASGYMQELRDRANISSPLPSLDLEWILDERARELQWEAKRRTDLIRFGLFTSSDYIWEFKGDVEDGQGTSNHLNLYPLSADDLIANPNLQQNPGY